MPLPDDGEVLLRLTIATDKEYYMRVRKPINKRRKDNLQKLQPTKGKPRAKTLGPRTLIGRKRRD